MEQKSRVMNIVQKIRTGVLFMVDLAGSERAANTKVYIRVCVCVCGSSIIIFMAVYVCERELNQSSKHE